MAKILVRKKGFTTRRGVHVRSTSFLEKDRGAPGRTPMKKRVIKFNPGSHSGFKKEYSVEQNAAIVEKKHGLHKGIQQMNSLSIISKRTDPETSRKARAVQKILSARLKMSKMRGK